MALYTAEEFRDIWAVVEQIGDARIEFCQNSATDELRTIIGDAAVDDAIENSPSNQRRAGVVKRAHAYLTASELVINTGVRMRPFGLTKTERDLESSVAANTTTEYQSAKDVQMLADKLHEKAEKILLPYLLMLSGDEEISDSPEIATGIVTTDFETSVCGGC